MAGVRRGFTLVELLLVLAIVAILSSLLIPILGQAKEVAWGVSCQGNLRQMGVAWEVVILDNASVIPKTYTSGGAQWDGLLLEVTGLVIKPDGAAIECPIAPQAYGDLASVATSYAVNCLWDVDEAPGDNEGEPWGALVSPTTYPLFADPAAIATIQPPVLFRYFGVDPARDWRLGFIHVDDTTNVAYGDGHVEAEGRDIIEGDVDTQGRPLWLFNRDPFAGIAMLR